MAKRTATSDLNHDNWDREDEPEDSGTFSKANEDALKRRVIKVAKRRNPISSSQNEDDKPKIFGGFSFAKTTPAPASTTFNFLSNLTNKTEPPKSTVIEPKSTVTEPKKANKLDEYYGKLKGLNESVADWINKHVTSNPLINLQPIFKDYDKYFSDLEKLKSEAETAESPKFSFGIPAATTTASSPPKFSFGATPTPSFGGNSLPSTATFSSGTSDKPSFSFGTPSTNGKFSFTSSVIKPADASSATETNEDDDEPPKVEFTPVVEEGHVYTTRCKVFVKKDGTFGDHGVGSLYIKPIPDNEKFQVFVRAETNLGKLICNFVLSEGIPAKRMGKKDVMLVCIPTPDAKPPPVPILLRVKSPEDADELLQTLEKYKK